MRNPINFIGACALVAVVAISVWSAIVWFPLPVVQAATTGSAVSSVEITVKDDRPLPVEQWDAY